MGISTSASSSNSVSSYQTNTANVGNSGIKTNTNVDNNVVKANIKDNNSVPVEIVDLSLDSNVKDYFNDKSIPKEDLYQYIYDNFKECTNVSISDLSEEEQAMVYEVLKNCDMENFYTDILTISRNDEDEFEITFNDGATRYFDANILAADVILGITGFYQCGYSNDCITRDEVDDICDSIGLFTDDIISIKDNGNNINIATNDGLNIIINKEDHSIKDVLDSNGNSVVNNIGMFSDEADKYGLYGGDQGYLINNSYEYVEDPHIKEILQKYFPNESLTYDEMIALFYKMNDVGCPYVAESNILFQMTANMSDEEFKEIFGFDRYCNKRMSDGTYVKTYNYNYMFLDYFLSYQKDYEGFNSLKDIIGTIEYDENGDLVINEYTGASGSTSWDVENYTRKYLFGKKIDYSSSTTSIDPDSFDTFSYYFDNPILEYAGGLIEQVYGQSNGIIIDAQIRGEVEKGNGVVIDMDDFTVYLPTDVDGNGKLDDIEQTHVGGHEMVVTGITEDGGYIVSSWGKKYIVRPKKYSTYEYYLPRDESLDSMTVYEY